MGSWRKAAAEREEMAGRNLDDIDGEIREVHGRTFRKLGSLLIEIVDRKLFQLKGFSNVEDYFNSEVHLPSARQAFRLISATRFSRQLPESLPQPKSERQVRPLLGRPLGEAKLLWAITTILAKERNCPIDGRLVARAVKDYQEGRLSKYVALGEALIDNKSSENQSKNQASDSPPPPLPSPPRPKRRGRGAQKRVAQPSGSGPTRKKPGPSNGESDGPEPRALGPSGLQDAKTHHSLDPSSGSSGRLTGGRGDVCGREKSQLVVMVEQISSLVSNLAHAWGFMDIAAGLNLPTDYCTLSGIHNNDSFGLFPNGFGNEEEIRGLWENGQQRQASSSTQDQDIDDCVELRELVQKTLLQLTLLVHRMGDPSCMWAMWAPGWGNDRNYWAMPPGQPGWFEAYGLRSSCGGEGVPHPSVYPSPLVPTPMMGAPEQAIGGASPAMVDCPVVPGPKWPADYEDGRVPGSCSDHQSSGWQHMSRLGNQSRAERGGAPDCGENGLNGVLQQDERVDTKGDQQSHLKRAPDCGSLSARQVKAVRRSVSRETLGEKDGEERGGGDVEPTQVQEIDEMAVAEALLCMSHQASK